MTHEGGLRHALTVFADTYGDHSHARLRHAIIRPRTGGCRGAFDSSDRRTIDALSVEPMFGACVVAQRTTLTEKQVELLRWVADGSPVGVMKDDFHRISAAALRNRGLITTSGQGRTWNAEVTPAGANYLKQVDDRNPPVPRQANISVTQQLVDDVIGAGGSLRVEQRRWGGTEGVDYEQRARRAQRHGKVPAGKRLTSHYVEGELEIRLEEAIPGSEVALQPVPVPQRVQRLHPVAKRFRDDTEKHLVSRAQLPRCIRIIHALATEAERRGHAVENVEGTHSRRSGERWRSDDGHLIVAIRGHGYRVKVSEERVGNRGAFDAETEYRRSVNYPQYLKPRTRTRYDQDATGRLQITCDGYGRRGGRPATWADRQSWTLEDKLPELLQELEIRAAEDDHAAIERQREAEERQRQWELAMERAKQRFLEHYREQVLRAQVAAWREAHTIRDYLSMLQERHGTAPESADWIAWIGRYVDERLDPLASPPAMPGEPEIKPDHLKPFLDGVSPYGPR